MAFNVQEYFGGIFDGMVEQLDQQQSQIEDTYNQSKLTLAQKESDIHKNYLFTKDLTNALLLLEDSKENRNKHIINNEMYDGKKKLLVDEEQSNMKTYMEQLQKIKNQRDEIKLKRDMMSNPQITVTNEEIEGLPDEDFYIHLLNYLKDKFSDSEAKSPE